MRSLNRANRFRDRSSALRTLVISLASTNADSSSNLGVVAPVMGDTLVFEATRLHTAELPVCILRYTTPPIALFHALSQFRRVASVNCKTRNVFHVF